MLPTQQISIGGKFKFDVYDKIGELKYSSNHNNFVTSTGLCFPSQYSFADCFRFLSFGSGTTANSISMAINGGWGTTGLAIPLSDFAYIGGRTSYGVADSTLYETEACGYSEQDNRVILSRAWRVPTGGSLFSGAYTFKEFMVSPGKPPTKGFAGDEACHCDEFVVDEFSNSVPGPDCAEVAKFYTNPSICKGNKAFARIIKDVTVAKDDYLVVTYDLSLSFQSGIKPYGINISNTKGGTNWTGVLTGYSNIIHHGIRLVNNGNVTSVPAPNGTRAQIATTYSFSNEYGEAFIPSWGAPLEPTCTEDKLVAYLSTDNLQFLVNSVSGGARITGLTSSGLMRWRSTPSQDVSTDFPERFFDIRMKGDKQFYPLPTDVNSEDSAESFDFEVDYMPHSALQHTALVVPFVQSGRSRSSRYACQFWGWKANNSGFATLPVRALVLAYFDATSTNFTPFFDVLLNDRSRVIVPPTGSATYTVPSSNYFYMEDGGDLTLQFDMSWSSPCATGVVGC